MNSRWGTLLARAFIKSIKHKKEYIIKKITKYTSSKEETYDTPSSIPTGYFTGERLSWHMRMRPARLATPQPIRTKPSRNSNLNACNVYFIFISSLTAKCERWMLLGAFRSRGVDFREERSRSPRTQGRDIPWCEETCAEAIQESIVILDSADIHDSDVST